MKPKLERRAEHGGGSRAQAGAIEHRLQACFETLPNSERQAAEFLLNFPGQLATHSATEIASLSGTSKAAVTRLIQRLGFASYADARAEARNAQQWGSPVYMSPEPAGDASGERTALDRHIGADAEILHKTLQAIRPEDIDEVVEALVKARRVLVIGHRNSALLASYVRSHLGLLRSGVELAPLHGETLAEGLYGMGPEDLLFAIGFRRRVPGFVSALEIARSHHVRVVLLTDPSGASLHRHTDWALTCHCRGASIFDSYVAAISLTNFVANQLAARLGTAGRARLREIEGLHEALGDLV